MASPRRLDGNSETVRTRVACKNCNARRVRCDRTASGGVCSQCQLLNINCVLIESKRGKHKRLSQKARLKTSSNQLRQSVEEEELPTPTSDTSPQSRSESQRTGTARYVSPSITDLVFDRESGPPNSRVVYMGDSNNMKYLVHEVGDPFKNHGSSKLWGDHLQRSLTERLGPATLSKLGALRSVEDEYLRHIGALQSLDACLGEELIDIFFDQAFPLFPIFDPMEFRTSHKQGRISPLVLNALYCVAAIHCSDDLIKRLGFDSRYFACSTFYRRAKALHETDHDTDGISNLQAGILLMNWWGGPMEQKDTWYWLGVATNLAQALGMHRAKSYSILPVERQKLWRRIWWVLFINDVHHAAVFGRPPHIHSQYSDVEPLSLLDMSTCTPDSSSSNEGSLFQVEMCRLALLLDRCMLTKFTATSDIRATRQAYTDLVNYRSAFPSATSHETGTLSINQGYYPAILKLIHLDYLIVTHRMLLHNDSLSESDDKDASFKSAGMISRILEDLLSSTSDLISRMPFLAFPAIFCSVLIHVIYLRKESGNVRVLAENRAKLAMAVLDKLQDRWPLVVWTRYLLKVLLKETKTATLGTGTTQSAGQTRPVENSTTQQMGGRVPMQAVIPGNASHQDFGDVTTLGRESNIHSGGHRGNLNNRAEHLRIDLGAVDASFSPMPFMFPLSGFLEDAGMEFEPWDLDMGMDEHL